MSERLDVALEYVLLPDGSVLERRRGQPGVVHSAESEVAKIMQRAHRDCPLPDALKGRPRIER